jgi:hypothetical protein
LIEKINENNFPDFAENKTGLIKKNILIINGIPYTTSLYLMEIHEIIVPTEKHKIVR